MQHGPYSEKMREVLANLAAQPRTEGDSHPLLQHREVKHITVIHITADRGLCGGLNANINRRTASFILEQSIPVNLITVGRKGRDFMSRYGRDIRAEFTQLGDKPSLVDTTPISRVVIDDYTNKLTDEIYLAYTEFITTAIQRPVFWKLLPIEPAKIRTCREHRLYLRALTISSSGRTSATLRRDAGLPRHIGVHSQRTISQDGSHAQRYR